jgi:hypothetical protein
VAADVPESHRDLIAARGFAHVATIGPRGEPHSSPAWYEWDRDHLLFSHTKRRQKYRNVADDPDGSLAHGLARAYRGSDRFTGDPSDRVIVKVTPRG